MSKSSLSRRDFMRQAAVVGGGVLLAGCATEPCAGAGGGVGVGADDCDDGGGDPDSAGDDARLAGSCEGLDDRVAGTCPTACR